MSASKKVVYQALDEKEYAQTFSTFIERSSEYGEMLKLVTPVVDSFEQRPIDLLSVGAGTLFFEKDLMEKVGLKVNYLYAIEPNEVHLEELKSTITQLSLSYDIDPIYFTTEFSTEKRFDMILMSHSMYCMADPIGAILKAKSLLKPNGKVIIFNQGEQGGYELYTRFISQAELSCRPINDHSISSKEIAEALCNNAVAHEVRYGPSVMEVHDFVMRKATPNTNHVISFLLQTKYEHLAENLRDQIYEMVKERSSIGKDGKYVLTHPTAMIVVQLN